MRIEHYGCDQCGKEFGDDPHLNVKQATVRLSFKNKGKWNQKSLQPQSQCNQSEYHFCNSACLGSFIGEMETKVRSEVSDYEHKA